MEEMAFRAGTDPPLLLIRAFWRPGGWEAWGLGVSEARVQVECPPNSCPRGRELSGLAPGRAEVCSRRFGSWSWSAALQSLC